MNNNLDKNIERIVKEIAYSAGDTIGMGYEADIAQLKALILKTCEEVVGEDEDEGEDDYEEMPRYHRNRLRVKQRERLKKL